MGFERTIVILRNGDVAPSIVEREGDFIDWITRGVRGAWGGEVVAFDAREPLPPGLASAAGVILSGSPASVTERAPWMLALEAVLRELVARNRPLLGICFGHQIVAQALGGEVARNPRGREIGTVTVRRLADDPIFHRLDPTFAANATHVDTVVRLPPGARVLATTALDDVAAYALGRARCVQFHPEIHGSAMRALIELRRSTLEAEGFAVDPMLDGTLDAPAGMAILENFIRSFVEG